MLYRIVHKLQRLMQPCWLSGGVVSLSFDDQWHSAYLHALPLLEEHGFKATWFVACNLVGSTDLYSGKKYMTWDEIINVAELGHEIGSHTLSHQRLSTMAANQALIIEELQESKHQIELKTSRKVDSFAYPFSDQGDEQGKVCALAGKIYKYSRGGDHGFNSWPFRTNGLFAWPLYENIYDIQWIKHLINYCMKHDVWLIFYTHDIEMEPTDYGCTPKYFECLLAYLRETNITVKPIGHVGRTE